MHCSEAWFSHLVRKERPRAESNRCKKRRHRPGARAGARRPSSGATRLRVKATCDGSQRVGQRPKIIARGSRGRLRQRTITGAPRGRRAARREPLVPRGRPRRDRRRRGQVVPTPRNRRTRRPVSRRQRGHLSTATKLPQEQPRCRSNLRFALKPTKLCKLSSNASLGSVPLKLQTVDNRNAWRRSRSNAGRLRRVQLILFKTQGVLQHVAGRQQPGTPSRRILRVKYRPRIRRPQPLLQLWPLRLPPGRPRIPSKGRWAWRPLFDWAVLQENLPARMRHPTSHRRETDRIQAIRPKVRSLKHRSRKLRKPTCRTSRFRSQKTG